MASNWKHALLDQAEADFQAYTAIQSISGIRECHLIQFLQMAVEKLLKGLKSNGLEPPEIKHNVFQNFYNLSGNLPNVSQALGYPDNAQFVRYMSGLRTIIEQLESYVPTGGKQQENAEYPWEGRSLDTQGNLQVDVSVPARNNYSFLSQADLSDLLAFVKECLAAYRAGKL
jgi:hypothetical protein